MNVDKRVKTAQRRNPRLGAIGEELVKYNLLARDWDVINLNAVGNNRPNADLLAVKGKHVVRIQVKTSKYRDAVQLGWIGEEGSNVNSKIGEPADFFALVGHEAPNNYTIVIVPASHMKDWESRNRTAHAAHGRMKNPGYVYFGDRTRKTKFEINQSGAEFAEFVDAWHILELSR
ncbi:MAG: hypothetical protein KGO53_02800 [Alphaproteobacteria bacterium]|nr:hypothetical protein [Alphaproteobacteria bacterium]